MHWDWADGATGVTGLGLPTGHPQDTHRTPTRRTDSLPIPGTIPGTVRPCGRVVVVSSEGYTKVIRINCNAEAIPIPGSRRDGSCDRISDCVA